MWSNSILKNFRDDLWEIVDAIELLFGVLRRNGLATVSAHLSHQKGPNPHGPSHLEVLDAVVQKQYRFGILRGIGNLQGGRKCLGGVLCRQIAALDVDNVHKEVLDPQCLETPLGVMPYAGRKNVFGNAGINGLDHIPEFLVFGQVLKDGDLVEGKILYRYKFTRRATMRQISTKVVPSIFYYLVFTTLRLHP